MDHAWVLANWSSARVMDGSSCDGSCCLLVVTAHRHHKAITLFACWFQTGLFNQAIMFFSQKNQHQAVQTSTSSNQRTRSNTHMYSGKRRLTRGSAAWMEDPAAIRAMHAGPDRWHGGGAVHMGHGVPPVMWGRTYARRHRARDVRRAGERAAARAQSASREPQGQVNNSG